MVKRPFIAIYDYGHGAVIVRVFASRASEVAKVLRPPTWQIFAESDPNAPDVSGRKILESDIDAKEDWLSDQIYMQDRQQEGKLSRSRKKVVAQLTGGARRQPCSGVH